MRKKLINYLKENVSDDEIAYAWDRLDEMRCPLAMADRELYDKLMGLIDDFAFDNGVDIDDIYDNYDIEELFKDL